MAWLHRLGVTHFDLKPGITSNCILNLRQYIGRHFGTDKILTSQLDKHGVVKITGIFDSDCS